MFLVPLIVAAHLCSPHTPRSIRPFGPWRRWALQGIAPLAIGAVVFLLLDPMVVLYPPEVPRRRRGSDLESPAWRIAAVVECEFPRRAATAVLVHQSPAVGDRAGVRGLGRSGRVLAGDEKDAAGAGGGRVSPRVLRDCRADGHAVHPLLAAADSGTRGRRRRPVRGSAASSALASRRYRRHGSRRGVDGAVRRRVHEHLCAARRQAPGVSPGQRHGSTRRIDRRRTIAQHPADRPIPPGT